MRACCIIRRMNTLKPDASTVLVENLRRASDARGQVFEPLAEADLKDQRNVHVVLTGPQHIRGNHFHHHGTEVMTVVGPALVRYREEGTIFSVDVPPDECWRFTFPPRVTHAVQNTGRLPMVTVSFNTAVHDPARPDTERDPIL